MQVWVSGAHSCWLWHPKINFARKNKEIALTFIAEEKLWPLKGWQPINYDVKIDIYIAFSTICTFILFYSNQINMSLYELVSFLLHMLIFGLKPGSIQLRPLYFRISWCIIPYQRKSCKMNKWYCVHLSCWVKHWLTSLQNDLTKQEFLQGHNNRVSCIALSHNGKFLASGQVP